MKSEDAGTGWGNKGEEKKREESDARRSEPTQARFFSFRNDR